MPRTRANGVDIEFDVMGEPGQPVLLMVSGLGAQMVSWDDDFCHALASLGLRVVRFDNRDAGLSSHIDDGRDPMALVLQRLSGEDVEAPYLLADLAADAVGLLDALDIGEAHVLGFSMGGMIAQSIAIGYPERVRTLTSVMSTTGDTDVGHPDPSVLGPLTSPMPTEPALAIDRKMQISELIGSPGLFDPVRARRRAELEVQRSLNPSGTTRQMLAIMSSPSRSEALRSLTMPSLVVHGDADPLVALSGGLRTHECLSSSQLMVIEGMGHDMPEPHWDRFVGAVGALVK